MTSQNIIDLKKIDESYVVGCWVGLRIESKENVRIKYLLTFTGELRLTVGVVYSVSPVS